MEKARLSEALTGLMAYDLGATDSGIHDEELRADVKAYLGRLEENDLSRVLGEFVREQYLSDAALEEGYGLEEVREFIDWLRSGMDITI
jgi:hypothetical protein